MKDIFRAYKRHNFLHHLWLLSFSLVASIAINMIFFSDISPQLLTWNSLWVAESQVESRSWDIRMEVVENVLKFYNTQGIQEVKEVSISLAYDPDNTSFLEYISTDSSINISQIQNESGFITYILSYNESLSISSDTLLFEVSLQKLTDTPSFINTININFKDDTDKIYLLSSSGIIF